MKQNNCYLLASWFARFAVGLVFAMNVACALSFVLQPQNYSVAFELSGLSGKIVVRAFGILFLMWNATYPPVLVQPNTQRTLFAVILAQQAIGVVGETWMWLELPAGHPALQATGLRFIVFDGLGLLVMGAAYVLMRIVGASPPDRLLNPLGRSDDYGL